MNLKFIKKESLEENDKILNYFGTLKLTFKAQTTDEFSHLIHTVNHLVSVSQQTEELVEKKKFKYDIGEIIFVPYDVMGLALSGILYFKKGGKKIWLHSQPINLNDRSKLNIVYSSAHEIQNVRYQKMNVNNIFYIGKQFYED